MALTRIRTGRPDFIDYDDRADVIVRVIYSDKKRGTKTFSFSFSNATREKVFGQSDAASFGYDNEQPTRLYFSRGGRNDYKLTQPASTVARWYARPSNLLKAVETVGKCAPTNFEGLYMAEYSKEYDMYFIDCNKRIF